MSGVTLIHAESDTEPECEVSFGAGHLAQDDKTDMRRVTMRFSLCYFARTGYHEDSGGVESIGYRVAYPEPPPDGLDYLNWWRDRWHQDGLCPDSGFFVAESSAWLASLPEQFRRDSNHYVIDGRDGYVELIAQGFEWNEWIWKDGLRDDVPSNGPIVDQGSSSV